MRDIFSDLYNKVLSFFVDKAPHDETKDVAMNRLKTVLMQDRVGFSERAMQMLKDELVSTISKYMEIDEESFDLEINPDDEKTVLSLSIPVTRAKTDEEIDEAIKEQAVKTQAKAQEIVEELEELIKERAAVLAGVKEDSEEDIDESERPDETLSEEEIEVGADEADETEEADESDISEEEPEQIEDITVEAEPQKKSKKSKVKEN